MNIDKHLPDEKLLLLIKQGNESAIATLLDRHKSKFYTAVYFLVKDHYVAEDIFQDACIKIFQNIRCGKYSDNGKFIPWAMRITRNLALDYLRITKRMLKVTLPDGIDIFDAFDFSKEEPETNLMNEENFSGARKLLASVPYLQREVIVLRLYGNLSFKEIAILIGVPINTALGRMRYGLDCLRKMREEQGVLQEFIA